ncbi:hypothetical protein QR680_016654 [Steinernema hermaphroditum]|uniref:Uncharacterized protein n=1 Tax=Steinernema hermaphroditum TaxID=289476 RepID=A0AA39HE11_9BILA|nr:hypothetical protein QR680_016654 [Steinernema hermaphroditum]
MTSDDLRFGAVACVSTIKNPIVAAKQLVVNQIARKQGGLIAPSILIGEGAEKFAAGCDIELCAPDGLVSPRAEMTYEKALRKLAVTEERLDTNSGLATSGISSGGIILKFDGRVGHSSQFGGGVWAEKRGLRSVAVSTSGCGEALARTHFAQKLGESLLEYDPSDGLYVEAINETFKKGFLESPLVTKSFIPEHRLAGGVAIIRDEDEGISEVIVFHNTKHFAYAFSDGSVSKRGLSELKEGQQFCAKSFQL